MRWPFEPIKFHASASKPSEASGLLPRNEWRRYSGLSLSSSVPYPATKRTPLYSSMQYGCIGASVPAAKSKSVAVTVPPVSMLTSSLRAEISTVASATYIFSQTSAMFGRAGAVAYVPPSHVATFVPVPSANLEAACVVGGPPSAQSIAAVTSHA